jgi:hypothetical protein
MQTINAITNTVDDLYHLVAGRIVYRICTLIDAAAARQPTANDVDAGR